MFHRNIKRTWFLVAAMLLGSLPSLFVLGDEPADRLRNKNKKSQEWPQFHGPKRNNISADTGLLKRWPQDGPKLVWRASGLGKGWATVAISGGLIYTAGDIGPDTMITAMDSSGKKLWQTKNGSAYKKNPPGARATPTLSGGKLYHLNGVGDVICLDAKTGKAVWNVNILKKFDGRNIRWGLAESLLVDGNKVFCCPGGEEVSLVALDKDTGKTIWTCTGANDKPGYTSAIMVDHGGLRQIVTVMAASAVGVASETGKLLWQYKHEVPYGANCTSPIFHEGNLTLFGTWGRGASMLKLTVDGAKCTAKEIWRTKDLDNEHGGVVLVDGYFYGQADGDHKRRHWACVEMKTGKTMWSAPELAGVSGALTYADGMLYLLSDRGTVALVPASPKGFKIVSRFDLPKDAKRKTWAHPVVNNGRLYVRHENYLYVYDVRAGK